MRRAKQPWTFDGNPVSCYTLPVSSYPIVGAMNARTDDRAPVVGRAEKPHGNYRCCLFCSVLAFLEGSQVNYHLLNQVACPCQIQRWFVGGETLAHSQGWAQYTLGQLSWLTRRERFSVWFPSQRQLPFAVTLTFCLRSAYVAHYSSASTASLLTESKPKCRAI